MYIKLRQFNTNSMRPIIISELHKHFKYQVALKRLIQRKTVTVHQLYESTSRVDC